MSDDTIRAPRFASAPDPMELGARAIPPFPSLLDPCDPEALKAWEPHAERAYARYLEQRGGLTYDGKPCPTWGEMRPDIKLGWCAAAIGAIEVFTGVATEPAANPATKREPGLPRG